jgi:hypothetical protein
MNKKKKQQEEAAAADEAVLNREWKRRKWIEHGLNVVRVGLIATYFLALHHPLSAPWPQNAPNIGLIVVMAATFVVSWFKWRCPKCDKAIASIWSSHTNTNKCRHCNHHFG